jgi:predicted small lipoprotein YifL
MSVFKRLGAASAALALALGLAACGEKVTVYEPGKYKGSAVVQPWDSPQFKGDKAAWERALQVRAGDQNEYLRVPAK